MGNKGPAMTSTGHRLRSLAHKHLKEKECASLKQAIQSFRETKSVLTLCTTLKGILTTKEKLSLLVAIYPMIPTDHQEDFDRLCCLHFDMYQLTSGLRYLRGTVRQRLKETRWR